MASRKFRFVSPGVFLKETDKSQLPGTPEGVGPVIIGRTKKGPALTPYKVRSLEEFERVFGGTSPGSEGDDPWREGTDLLAESYAPYAAKAYLSADIDSPVTIVRLAGIAGDNADATDPANPGWKTANSYGLFLFTSASDRNPADARDVTGTLAAVFYGDTSFTASLYGTADLWLDGHDNLAGARLHAVTKEDANKKFTIRLSNGATRTKDVVFSPASMRKGFNTNPIKTNSNISEETDSGLADLYWLGETFEEAVNEITANKGSSDTLAAAIVELDPLVSDYKSSGHALTAARSGWFIAQDTSGASTGIVHADRPDLFRAIARQEGFQASRDLMISIERINIPRDNATDVYSSFSLVVNEIRGTNVIEVERFDKLNLNPSSENYIAKKIGTQYYVWSAKEKRNKTYGTHPNVSEYIRIEMHKSLIGKPPETADLAPVGFRGPVVPKAIDIDFTATGAATLGSKWAEGSVFAGALTSNAASKLHLKWPQLPLVNSGSLSDGYMMGASPFKQSWSAGSAHTTNTILNPGYVDYLRKASSYVTHEADQTSGKAAGAETSHSFIFSMEDVVIHPKNGTSVAAIDSLGDIDLVEYIEGSRNGSATAATSTISVSTPAGVQTAPFVDNQRIKVSQKNAGGSSNTVRYYYLVDASLSDADTTSNTYTPLTTGTVIGVNSTVTGTKSTLANAIKVNAATMTTTGDAVRFNVPASAGGSGTDVNIRVRATADVAAATAAYAIVILNTALTPANVANAINGVAAAGITFAPSGDGMAGTGVKGLEATTTGADDEKVTLSVSRPGAHATTIEDQNGNTAKSAGANAFITATGTIVEMSNSGAGHIAVAVATGATERDVVKELKTAILGSTGHNGGLLIRDDHQDGSIIVEQTVSGVGGNSMPFAVENLANFSATDSAGGATVSSYAKSVADGTATSLRTLFDHVDGFRAPMVGGFEGVDIIEADPFNNRVINKSPSTTKGNYAYASVDRAIELVRDAEMVEHNLAVMPGITNSSLTTKLVRDCEARGDSLAIIDLPDVYKPPFEEKCDNFEQRMPSSGNPENSAKSLTDRQLNSSYGATYYPWVKIKDEVYNRDVWVPPSVVALGVMAYTEQRDEVWFAPAGFNRGGLNEGNAGVPVLQVSDQLMSKDRDTLYAANINPIASFVSEGIVIFGQKTLQTTQSALDRINVRRLLIFVKKRVSRVSKDLLFEQNVRATWNKFLGQVNPFLESVKTRFGLSDYKVVLDSTTTTPDLVDRNILYAKVLLKPARSIEFIAVDFVITNTGASFED